MQYTTLLLTTVASLALAQETIVTVSEGLTTILTLPAFPSGSAPTAGTGSGSGSGSSAAAPSDGTTTTTTAPPTGDATGAPIPTGVNSDAQNSYISSLLSDAVNTTSSSSTSTGSTLSISVTTTTTTTNAGTGPYPTASGSGGGVANPTGSYATYLPSGTGAVGPIPTQFIGAASRAMGGSALALMIAVAGLVV